MKTKLRLTTTIIVAIGIFAIIGLSYAIDNTMGDARDERRNEVKEYADENIIPVITEWKTEFDEKLNSDDLNKLNELRQRAKTHKNTFRDGMRSRIQNAQSKKNIDKQAFRDSRKKHRDEMRSIFEELKPIAEKYKDDIEALSNKAKPFSEKWRSDMQEMRKNWRDNHEDCENRLESGNRQGFGNRQECDSLCGNENRQDRENWQEKRGNRGMKHHKKGFRQMDISSRNGIARFLLWDGSTDLFENRNPSMQKGINSNSDGSNSFNMNNNPNPFTENTSISFNLANEEYVALYIFDSSGKIVSTLCDGILSAGEHKFEFIPENDVSGVYYYNLKSETYTKTGKMVFSK